jgi:signal transduction histidine kinase
VPDRVIRNRCVAGKGVSLQTPLAETPPPIYGDRIQLQPVIVDLTINAVEAIGGGVGLWELLISTARTESNVLVRAVRVRGQASLLGPFIAGWEVSCALRELLRWRSTV